MVDATFPKIHPTPNPSTRTTTTMDKRAHAEDAATNPGISSSSNYEAWTDRLKKLGIPTWVVVHEQTNNAERSILTIQSHRAIALSHSAQPGRRTNSSASSHCQPPLIPAFSALIAQSYTVRVRLTNEIANSPPTTCLSKRSSRTRNHFQDFERLPRPANPRPFLCFEEKIGKWIMRSFASPVFSIHTPK